MNYGQYIIRKKGHFSSNFILNHGNLSSFSEIISTFYWLVPTFSERVFPSPKYDSIILITCHWQSNFVMQLMENGHEWRQEHNSNSNKNSVIDISNDLQHRVNYNNDEFCKNENNGNYLMDAIQFTQEAFLFLLQQTRNNEVI